MPLPIEDVLLLTLVAASMCALIVGDLRSYFGRREGLAAALAGWAAVPHQALQQLFFRKGPCPTERKPVLPLVADLLVVDDSAVARTKLRRLFVGAGYNVQLASDGIEALALLGKGRYSLMITDLEMPNMDGVALIHECLRVPQTAGMPIIAVSAHENLRAKFNECREICGVHRKPWADDILLSHVATLVGSGGHFSSHSGPSLRGAA